MIRHFVSNSDVVQCVQLAAAHDIDRARTVQEWLESIDVVFGYVEERDMTGTAYARHWEVFDDLRYSLRICADTDWLVHFEDNEALPGIVVFSDQQFKSLFTDLDEVGMASDSEAFEAEVNRIAMIMAVALAEFNRVEIDTDMLKIAVFEDPEPGVEIQSLKSTARALIENL